MRAWDDMGSEAKWYMLGLPDPDSPEGKHFDWAALGMPAPNSAAGQQFNYWTHPEFGNLLLWGGTSLGGRGKSGTLWVLGKILGWEGVDVPIQLALLRHYVAGTGEPCDLNEELGAIPAKWRVWIVKVTRGRVGTHRGINGENAQIAGLDDLSDSLGHFTVVVTQKPGAGAKIYEIKKEGSEQYQFGFTAPDVERRHRHGCRLPLSEAAAAFIRAHLMPTHMYPYGNALYDEQFKLQWQRVGRTKRYAWHLDLPWLVMANLGKPFDVHGRFEQ